MHPISQPLEADPTGDVILVIGDGKGQESVRVSSRVLNLASPVFAAMFSPKFAEGWSLVEANPSAITTISVPDDDPEALTWICEALHFRKRVKDVISFSLLRRIAIHCDKYDMSGALDPWSNSWMQNWSTDWCCINGVDQYPQMLWISYAFDNHEAFWSGSRELTRIYTSEGLLAVDELTNSILPERILDSINTLRDETLRELQTTIEDIITPILSEECGEQANHVSDRTPCYSLSKVGHYFQELHRLGLWPISRILNVTNLSTLSGQLMDFDNYFFDAVRNWYEHEVASGSCGSENPPKDLKTMLVNAANEAFEKQRGLCLVCVRQGKVTKEDGNCRAETQEVHNMTYNSGVDYNSGEDDESGVHD